MAVERPRKSLLKAYVLLLTLGYLGAHRFYLGRILSAISIILMLAVALVLLWNGYQTERQIRIYAGAVVGAAVISFMLIDLFMIPGMVERMNSREREMRVSPMMGNLDPSFQATMRQAGRDDETGEAPRRSALPEGFERPWNRRDGAEEMVYSPSAETAAQVQTGIPAHSIPTGSPPRPDRVPMDLGYADHTPRRRNRPAGA